MSTITLISPLKAKVPRQFYNHCKLLLWRYSLSAYQGTSWVILSAAMVGIVCRTAIYFIIIFVFLLVTTASAPMFNIPNPFAPHESWKTIAARRRQDIIAKIPNEWLLDVKVIDAARSRQSIAGDFFEELLDDQTRSITALDVTDLVESMRNKSWTAVEVVKAFSKRAAYAHQLVRSSNISRGFVF